MSNLKIGKSSVVQAQLRKDIPSFTVGSIVNVHYKITEGSKTRVQIFSGVVINLHEKNSLNATFKVLKAASGGINTMRTFPLHSPSIEKVEVVKLQRARRATLKYLIDKKDPVKSIRTKSVKVSAPVV